MSKKTSNFIQKKVFRQKSKKKHSIDQQPQVQIIKSKQAQHEKRDASKSKEKQIKNLNKAVFQKRSFQSSGFKLKSDQKQQTQTYALCIKAELTHKLKKKCLDPPKNTDWVINLAKNLQKDYKYPKKNQHLQPYFQQKGNIEQQIKLRKQRKVSAQNKKCENRSKQKQIAQNFLLAKQKKRQKLDTLSRQISQGQFQRAKIQQKQKPNAKSNSCKKQIHKNMGQLFDLYKKAYQVENGKAQQKVQQSNRKTNYNTNLSKNSNAHHNPHSHLRASENNRGKFRDQIQKIKIHKIGSLVKNQQLQWQQWQQRQLQISNNHSLIVKAKFREISQEREQFWPNRSEIKDKLMKWNQKKDENCDFGGDFIRKSELQEYQNQSQHSIALHKEKKSINQLQNIKYNGYSLKRVLQAGQNRIQENERQNMFKKSQFYVQPIPKFEPKATKNQPIHEIKANSHTNNIIKSKHSHQLNEI